MGSNWFQTLIDWERCLTTVCLTAATGYKSTRCTSQLVVADDLAHIQHHNIRNHHVDLWRSVLVHFISEVLLRHVFNTMGRQASTTKICLWTRACYLKEKVSWCTTVRLLFPYTTKEISCIHLGRFAPGLDIGYTLQRMNFSLTHWGHGKMAAILGRRQFQMHFLEWKWQNSNSNFTEICSHESNWQ